MHPIHLACIAEELHRLVSNAKVQCNYNAPKWGATLDPTPDYLKRILCDGSETYHLEFHRSLAHVGRQTILQVLTSGVADLENVDRVVVGFVPAEISNLKLVTKLEVARVYF